MERDDEFNRLKVDHFKESTKKKVIIEKLTEELRFSTKKLGKFLKNNKRLEDLESTSKENKAILDKIKKLMQTKGFLSEKEFESFLS